MRDEVLHIGVSQVSAGSRTDPGGYSKQQENFDASQFRTSDHRSLDQMAADIAETGNLPSLCTSCYRVGRTGKLFTEKVSHLEMGKICLANAILTLKEYTIDHANGNKNTYNNAIERSIDQIKESSLKSAVLKKVKLIEEGKRDLYF